MSKMLRMKNGYWLNGLLALALLAGLTACSRHGSAVGNDCISRFTPDGTTPLIPQSELDTITGLFTQNNLPASGLQFTSIIYNAVYNPSQYSGPQDQVTANVYINGLPVFQGQEYFDFDSTGAFQPPAIGGWQGQQPGKDTTTRQSLIALRQAFLKNYKLCTVEGGPINSKPSHPTAPYDDTCLSAELGYMDANSINTNTPYGQQLIKVWLVCSSTSRLYPSFFVYPAVFVADSTGAVRPQYLIIP
jgi:hypothetical protein